MLLARSGIRRLQVLQTPYVHPCQFRVTSRVVGHKCIMHPASVMVSSLSFATSTTTNGYVESSSSSLKQVYLHIGPSGDCWHSFGELYAAKHLQPGYVKSFVLSMPKRGVMESDAVEVAVEELIEKLHTLYSPDRLQQVYDTGKLPEELVELWNDKMKDWE